VRHIPARVAISKDQTTLHWHSEDNELRVLHCRQKYELPYPPQVPFTKHEDQMVQTFPPNTADQSFGIGISISTSGLGDPPSSSKRPRVMPNSARFVAADPWNATRTGLPGGEGAAPLKVKHSATTLVTPPMVREPSSRNFQTRGGCRDHGMSSSGISAHQRSRDGRDPRHARCSAC